MTSDSRAYTRSSALRNAVFIFLLFIRPVTLMAQKQEAGAGVLVWDTLSPMSHELQLQDRSKWKPVPTDLLTLELNPDAAFSDPSYYGRGYSLQGDAVVENKYLTAVFGSG